MMETSASNKHCKEYKNYFIDHESYLTVTQKIAKRFLTFHFLHQKICHCFKWYLSCFYLTSCVMFYPTRHHAMMPVWCRVSIYLCAVLFEQLTCGNVTNDTLCCY